MRAAALALVLAVAPARADEAPVRWRIDAAESSIAFDYSIDGRAAAGAFRVLEGEGSFDPARPEASRLELRIDPRGLDLGDPLADAFAQSPEWFDSMRHPTVRYRLSRLTPMPDGRWLALGDITIKDRIEILETTVALDLGPDRASAIGTVAFDRRDFDLGLGLSALFVDLAPEVSVTFSLVARPAGAEENP